MINQADLQEPRYLNEPPHVVRVDVARDGPLGQLVPLVTGLAVDGQPQLGVLVLALLKVVRNLVDDAGKVLAVEVVVRLEEHLAQAALTDRVVLGVELVEAVEGVAVLNVNRRAQYGPQIMKQQDVAN